MTPARRRPWIAVTARWDAERGTHIQDRRYLDAVAWAGGVPVLIPLSSDEVLIREYAGRLHGVLLTGSPTDVDPRHYGSPARENLGAISEERDRTDFRLLDIADERSLPVLGVCYGAQSLNVFRGGTLVQDIPSEVPGALAHNRRGRPRSVISHDISIESGCRLRDLFGRHEMAVNSYHHQSVAAVGRNLRVAARAPDGVVEGIEDTRERFVVGVQWHPETDWETDPAARTLFSELVAAARHYSAR